MPRRPVRGFTLIELVIVVGIIAVLAAIAVPGLVSSQRSANERNASTSLKTVVTAEADFRSNDRDGNRVADYWTGDVAGLCLIAPQVGNSPPPAPLTFGSAIRLLDSSVASADGAFAGGVAYSSAQFVPVATALVSFKPKSGYWYVRLLDEVSIAGNLPFPIDTDGANNANWGACHNVDRFGFMAFPGSFGSGRLAFIVCNDGIIFKGNLSADFKATVTIGAATTSSVITGTNLPPGVATFEYPMPPAGGWSRMD
ncbi:MAG TPA: type II secretion system protein [Planctomycetota bacterium]|jgi:prepilin-type N-terminal cleavage/methylation domain-containing protein